MKKHDTVLVAVLILLGASPTFSRKQAGSFSLGGFCGIGMPLRPELLNDYWKTGFGFGGECRYLLNNRTGIVIGYGSQPFPSDSKSLNSLFGGLLNSQLGTLLDTDPNLALLRQQFPDLTIDWDFKFSGLKFNHRIFSFSLLRYLNDPTSPLAFYVTAGGANYSQSMENLNMHFTVSIHEPLLGSYEENMSETIDTGDTKQNGFGLNGGFGLEAGIGKRIRIFIEGKYHCVFTDKVELDMGEIPEDMREWAMDLQKKSEGKIQFMNFVAGIRLSL